MYNACMVYRTIKELIEHLEAGNLDNLLRDYKKLLQRIDHRFEEAHQFGEVDATCSPGCCDCCRGVFEISLLDSLLIMKKERSRRFAKVVYEKAKELISQVEMEGWSFPQTMGDIPENLEDKVAHLDQTPCPFLNEKQQCRIYSHRPSICRFQGVPFVDPVSGFVLEDECPLQHPDRHRIPFDLIGFNETEAALFDRLKDSVPGLGERELNDWDTMISTAILLTEID